YAYLVSGVFHGVLGPGRQAAERCTCWDAWSLGRALQNGPLLWVTLSLARKAPGVLCPMRSPDAPRRASTTTSPPTRAATKARTSHHMRTRWQTRWPRAERAP